jgi:hypothetical protein
MRAIKGAYTGLEWQVFDDDLRARRLLNCIFLAPLLGSVGALVGGFDLQLMIF